MGGLPSAQCSTTESASPWMTCVTARISRDGGGSGAGGGFVDLTGEEGRLPAFASARRWPGA